MSCAQGGPRPGCLPSRGEPRRSPTRTSTATPAAPSGLSPESKRTPPACPRCCRCGDGDAEPPREYALLAAGAVTTTTAATPPQSPHAERSTTGCTTLMVFMVFPIPEKGLTASSPAASCPDARASPRLRYGHRYGPTSAVTPRPARTTAPRPAPHPRRGQCAAPAAQAQPGTSRRCSPPTPTRPRTSRPRPRKRGQATPVGRRTLTGPGGSARRRTTPPAAPPCRTGPPALHHTTGGLLPCASPHRRDPAPGDSLPANSAAQDAALTRLYASCYTPARPPRADVTAAVATARSARSTEMTATSTSPPSPA